MNIEQSPDRRIADPPEKRPSLGDSLSTEELREGSSRFAENPIGD